LNIDRVILFIGPPGSGKGTLSQKCVQELGWEKISTGDLCRQHIENQTEIGKTIDFAIKSGKLVSDSLVSKMVFDWFKSQEGGPKSIILDGFPRTVNQAKAFDELADQLGDQAKVVIARFVIDDEAIVDRLENRYICSNKSCQRVYSLKATSSLAPQNDMRCDSCNSELIKRKDDNADAIRERLRVYHQHEQDLLSYYKEAGYEICELQSDMPIDQLFVEFRKSVEG
jgi:adenylate kinase